MYNFDTIYMDNHEVVRRTVSKIVYIPEIIDELVQETFLRAIKYINNFQGDSGIRYWLCRIARFAALNWIRDKRDTTHIDERYLIYNSNIDETIFRGEIRELYIRKLAELENVNIAVAGLLFFVHGHTRTDVKEMLDIKKETCNYRIRQAAKHLGELYGNMVIRDQV